MFTARRDQSPFSNVRRHATALAPIANVRRLASVFALVASFALAPAAEATFSICAVDPVTGEVGSAGASCISGSIILSDVRPAIGVVHTQAFWNSQNQQYARALMNAGYAPEAIIDSLVANDAQNNPGIRQYGIVDLVGDGRSAAFTGANCTDWKGHILGPNYAIQGNILLGPDVLADMEAAFLTTDGSLAEKLMAALQGAKRPGADTRCQPSNRSAISAFIRVAQPNDPANDLFLNLNVNNTTGSTDPIDVLQGLFDQWLTSADVGDDPTTTIPRLLATPNPFQTRTEIVYHLAEPSRVRLLVLDAGGRLIADLSTGAMSAGRHAVDWEPRNLAAGVYTLRLEADSAPGRAAPIRSVSKLVRLPR